MEGERHAEELHYCFASCASHRGLYCVTVYVYVCVYVGVRVYVCVCVCVRACAGVGAYVPLKNVFALCCVSVIDSRFYLSKWFVFGFCSMFFLNFCYFVPTCGRQKSNFTFDLYVRMSVCSAISFFPCFSPLFATCGGRKSILTLLSVCRQLFVSLFFSTFFLFFGIAAAASRQESDL